jgi:hypothetical protein
MQLVAHYLSHPVVLVQMTYREIQDGQNRMRILKKMTTRRTQLGRQINSIQKNLALKATIWLLKTIRVILIVTNFFNLASMITWYNNFNSLSDFNKGFGLYFIWILLQNFSKVIFVASENSYTFLYQFRKKTRWL